MVEPLSCRRRWRQGLIGECASCWIYTVQWKAPAERSMMSSVKALFFCIEGPLWSFKHCFFVLFFFWRSKELFSSLLLLTYSSQGLLAAFCPLEIKCLEKRPMPLWFFLLLFFIYKIDFVWVYDSEFGWRLPTHRKHCEVLRLKKKKKYCLS